MTDKEKLDLKLEIKARKLLLKKLGNVSERMNKQAQKQIDNRKAEVEQMSEYRSIEEARDAYGWNIITEEQFEEFKKMFEAGEDYVDNRVSAEEVASGMLNDFLSRIKRDIRSFEFELLPSAEQETMREKHRRIIERRKARFGGGSDD